MQCHLKNMTVDAPKTNDLIVQFCCIINCFGPTECLRILICSHNTCPTSTILSVSLSFQAILLLAGVALAQEAAENPNDQIRRLRFRRPRPKVVGVSDEEGVQQGRPIPLAAIPTRNQGRNEGTQHAVANNHAG